MFSSLLKVLTFNRHLGLVMFYIHVYTSHLFPMETETPCYDPTTKVLFIILTIND